MFRVGLYARVSTHNQKTLPLLMRVMRESLRQRSVISPRPTVKLPLCLLRDEGQGTVKSLLSRRVVGCCEIFPPCNKLLLCGGMCLELCFGLALREVARHRS
jgi:hypothetical protein